MHSTNILEHTLIILKYVLNKHVALEEILSIST